MKSDVKAKFIRRCDNVPSKEVEGELLLLNIKDGNYFGMNKSGMVIWKMLDGTKRIDDVSRALSRKFKVSLAGATKDVDVFLKELRRAGLIELV